VPQAQKPPNETVSKRPPGSGLSWRPSGPSGEPSRCCPQGHNVVSVSHLPDVNTGCKHPDAMGGLAGVHGRRPLDWGHAEVTAQHAGEQQDAWGATYILGSVVHLPLSGRRRQGERREVSGGRRREEDRRQVRPPCPARPAAPPTWASASMTSLIRGGPWASAPSMRT
jgi:hypothetical protein